MQFEKRVLHNLSTFMQVKSVSASRENNLDFFCLFVDDWACDKWYLATLVFYYRRSKSYSKQSVDSSMGVGVVCEAPMIYSICSLIYYYAFHHPRK